MNNNNEDIFVYLYTQQNFIAGSLYVPSGQRLTDSLNNVLMNTPNNRSSFIELKNVTTVYEDGYEEKSSSVYVNKSAIQFLFTSEIDTARGIGSISGIKPYPYVQKSPMNVKINTSSYQITGNIYCISGQDIHEVFLNKALFIPLTEATIINKEKKDLKTALFATINRTNIVSLHHNTLSEANLN